jgi:L-threonylcarbamoyladenylate synthase
MRENGPGGQSPPEEISRAAGLLQAGGVVAFPTETVYGLGADAENETAIRRVFSIKGRPADHPLIVHLANAGLLERWACEVPAAALRLAERFWPGPLTIVLRRAARASDLVTGGLDTVGIRVPAHPVAHALLREFGGGLAAPSANRYGRISPTHAAHVREELGSSPDMVLDGGACQVGLESTIISLAGDRPVLLRPGGISLEELGAVIGRDVDASPQTDPLLRAPGSHPSHYAPRAAAAIVPAGDLPDVAAGWLAEGRQIALLGFAGTTPPAFATAGSILLPDDPVRYGHDLYASLRALDATDCDVILIEEPPATAPWQAVRDRLARAAHPRV